MVGSYHPQWYGRICIEDSFLNRSFSVGKLSTPAIQSIAISVKVRQPRYTVVLDLNGFLVHRAFNKGRKIVARTDCENFLKMLTNKATVVVWSCTTRRNVNSMLQVALGSSPSTLEDLTVMSQSDSTESSFPRPGNNVEKKYMLKDLQKVREILKDVDLSLTLLIDDSPKKNLLNDEFNVIHPQMWTRDLNDKFLMNTMLLWLENMFSSNLSMAKYVRNHPLAGCPNPTEFRSTTLAQNIVIGCSRKWNTKIGKFH